MLAPESRTWSQQSPPQKGPSSGQLRFSPRNDHLSLRSESWLCNQHYKGTMIRDSIGASSWRLLEERRRHQYGLKRCNDCHENFFDTTLLLLFPSKSTTSSPQFQPLFFLILQLTITLHQQRKNLPGHQSRHTGHTSHI